MFDPLDRYEYGSGLVPLRWALLGLIHPILLLVLLTRPRVKDLFTRGSETGEGEG